MSALYLVENNHAPFGNIDFSKRKTTQFCHTGEGRYPGAVPISWIPAFAGMTCYETFWTVVREGGDPGVATLKLDSRLRGNDINLSKSL